MTRDIDTKRIRIIEAGRRWGKSATMRTQNRYELCRELCRLRPDLDMEDLMQEFIDWDAAHCDSAMDIGAAALEGAKNGAALPWELG